MVVDYEMEGIEPPILSVEEAVKKSSYFEVPPFIYPKQVGDISNGMAAADHKILSAEVLDIYMTFFFVFWFPFHPNTPGLLSPAPSNLDTGYSTFRLGFICIYKNRLYEMGKENEYNRECWLGFQHLCRIIH